MKRKALFFTFFVLFGISSITFAGNLNEDYTRIGVVDLCLNSGCALIPSGVTVRYSGFVYVHASSGTSATGAIIAQPGSFVVCEQTSTYGTKTNSASGTFTSTGAIYWLDAILISTGPSNEVHVEGHLSW